MSTLRKLSALEVLAAKNEEEEDEEEVEQAKKGKKEEKEGWKNLGLRIAKDLYEKPLRSKLKLWALKGLGGGLAGVGEGVSKVVETVPKIPGALLSGIERASILPTATKLVQQGRELMNVWNKKESALDVLVGEEKTAASKRAKSKRLRKEDLVRSVLTHAMEHPGKTLKHLAIARLLMPVAEGALKRALQGTKAVGSEAVKVPGELVSSAAGTLTPAAREVGALVREIKGIGGSKTSALDVIVGKEKTAARGRSKKKPSTAGVLQRLIEHVGKHPIKSLAAGLLLRHAGLPMLESAARRTVSGARSIAGEAVKLPGELVSGAASTLTPAARDVSALVREIKGIGK